MGREYAWHTSWCHPRSGIAPPLHWPECAGAPSSAGVLPMALRRRLSAVAALSKSGSPWYCSRVLARYQRRERLGRIISRQSRSPRCRPRMSISAEARVGGAGDVVAVAQVNGLHHPLILPGVVAVGGRRRAAPCRSRCRRCARPPAGGRPDGWRETARRADPWPRPRDGRW